MPSDKGDINDKPIIGNYTTGDVADGLSFGNEELRKDILTKFDQSVGAFVPGTPGRKDPMMNIDIVIPKEKFSQSQNESFIMESVSVNERRNVSRGGMSFPSQLTDGLNDALLQLPLSKWGELGKKLKAHSRGKQMQSRMKKKMEKKRILFQVIRRIINFKV